MPGSMQQRHVSSTGHERVCAFAADSAWRTTVQRHPLPLPELASALESNAAPALPPP